MPDPLNPSALNDYYRALFAETGECLVWSGCASTSYGQKRHDGQMQKVHRLAWEQAFGPIPAGLVVKHLCDNPPCYRLDHLVLGTYCGNIRDAIERGQFRSHGENNRSARLTEADVLAIRASPLSGPILARKYGVAVTCINRARTGRTWAYLPGATPPKKQGAKLTEAEALEIRASKERASVLALRYGVTAQNVYAIRKGRTWK